MIYFSGLVYTITTRFRYFQWTKLYYIEKNVLYAISSTFATWPMELRYCPYKAAQRHVFVLYTPKRRPNCQVLQFAYSWPTFLG